MDALETSCIDDADIAIVVPLDVHNLTDEDSADDDGADIKRLSEMNLEHQHLWKAPALLTEKNLIHLMKLRLLYQLDQTALDAHNLNGEKPQRNKDTNG